MFPLQNGCGLDLSELLGLGGGDADGGKQFPLLWRQRPKRSAGHPFVSEIMHKSKLFILGTADDL